MNYFIRYTFILVLCSSTLLAQNILPSSTSGYVNFNLGASTIKTDQTHGVTLLGCNTIISNQNSKNWSSAPNGLQWHTKNQVFTNIPYGYQIDSKTNKSYYVAKYYIASPPVFNSDKNGKPAQNTAYDIGIVTPDEFGLKGEKPVQQVYMDYDILELTKIDYIQVLFDTAFDSLKVNIVPFKVESKDFSWLNKKRYNNAKGASGIGYLDRTKPALTKLFLPYYAEEVSPNQDKYFLDFEVTILNDILLHHKIYFIIDDEKRETINLKDYYNKHKKDTTMQIHLYCEYSSELSCGCKEPISPISPISPIEK
ncbi:hypothetical protein FIA58_018990 [Flavobacterium jejuense]|uniref:Uncharacterized protein n=1 Tax=Flavobacterium jejuense TaxID=1544455 RepID=A0ABX0IW27_9FLAO|nr:hypothetical protein [Flavobacterium jejuense]NHN27771.1 hypothetical protein [Flavobacterium jejuense]